jgi:hypothetical protein
MKKLLKKSNEVGKKIVDINVLFDVKKWMQTNHPKHQQN